MKKLTIVAATIALGALFAAPASAERNWGPLTQNGKCWNNQAMHTTGGNVGTWGYWSDCPKPASAAVTTTRHRRSSSR